MRTALISDIHGNLTGLQAVLADIATQGCDRILCLGDLVDGGPHSIEVVDLLRSLGVPTVRGNHDEFPNETLTTDVLDYLVSLPEAIVEGDVLYTHTSPRRKKDKITDGIEAWNVFEETKSRRIFVSDVHVPLLFGAHCTKRSRRRSTIFPTGSRFRSTPMTATSSVSARSATAGTLTIGCATSSTMTKTTGCCSERRKDRCSLSE